MNRREELLVVTAALRLKTIWAYTLSLGSLSARSRLTRQRQSVWPTTDPVRCRTRRDACPANGRNPGGLPVSQKKNTVDALVNSFASPPNSVTLVPASGNVRPLVWEALVEVRCAAQLTARVAFGSLYFASSLCSSYHRAISPAALMLRSAGSIAQSRFGPARYPGLTGVVRTVIRDTLFGLSFIPVSDIDLHCCCHVLTSDLRRSYRRFGRPILARSLLSLFARSQWLTGGRELRRAGRPSIGCRARRSGSTR